MLEEHSEWDLREEGVEVDFKLLLEGASGRMQVVATRYKGRPEGKEGEAEVEEDLTEEVSIF